MFGGRIWKGERMDRAAGSARVSVASHAQARGERFHG